MDRREQLLEKLRRKRKRLKKRRKRRINRAHAAGGRVASARLAKILVNPTGSHPITALQARGCRASKARWLRHPPTLSPRDQEILAAYNSGMPAHQVEAIFTLTKRELINLRLKATRVEKWRRLAAEIAADPRLMDVPTTKAPGIGADLPGHFTKGLSNASSQAASGMVYAEGFRTVAAIPGGEKTGSEIESTTHGPAGATDSAGRDTRIGGAGSSCSGRGDPPDNS